MENLNERSPSMKRVLAAAAFLLAAASARAQFEGEADFKITTYRDKGNLDGTAKMYTGKSGFRMEWAMTTPPSSKGGKPATIKMTMIAAKPNPEKVYLVNDENKTYSVWDTQQGRDSLKKAPKESYKVEKLGTDKVAGYTCANARVTSSKGSVFDVCVTKELGPSADWLAAMNRSDPDAQSWLQALKDDGIDGFPVRWSVRDKSSGKVTMSMEMTRADRKPLPASLFVVPAGYKETNFAVGGLTPEQQKAMGDAQKQMQESMKDMTPEQRRQVEEMMKRYGQPTPVP
jgi:hypothetical protein